MPNLYLEETIAKLDWLQKIYKEKSGIPAKSKIQKEWMDLYEKYMIPTLSPVVVVMI